MSAGRAGGLSRRIWLACGAALLLAGWGIFSRLQTRAALGREVAAAAVPVVSVVSPTSTAQTDALILPANVQAYSDAPIYSRTNGYLRRRLVDIGSRVKRGQLLAEIDAPEVTQQIAQGKAQLATAQAAEHLAQSTAARWSALLDTNAVSPQNVEEKLADAAGKRAELAAAQANLNRLRQLGEFQRIVAPFDGVITARGTDVGALVSAGSGPGAGAELFHIQDLSRLHVYVNTPQAFAPLIKRGSRARLKIAELPGKQFEARTINTAESLDSASRTLLTQLEVDNADEAIRPGSYGEVEFDVSAAGSRLRIPANCLLFRAAGLSVATVDGQGLVTVKTITLGLDFGKEVEVVQGLSERDRVILNPADSMQSGLTVRVAVSH